MHMTGWQNPFILMSQNFLTFNININYFDKIYYPSNFYMCIVVYLSKNVYFPNYVYCQTVKLYFENTFPTRALMSMSVSPSCQFQFRSRWNIYIRPLTFPLPQTIPHSIPVPNNPQKTEQHLFIHSGHSIWIMFPMNFDKKIKVKKKTFLTRARPAMTGHVHWLTPLGKLRSKN